MCTVQSIFQQLQFKNKIIIFNDNIYNEIKKIMFITHKLLL